MKNHRENITINSPLSESSVSLKLSLIQKRCSELMNKTDGLELTLEEPEPYKKYRFPCRMMFKPFGSEDDVMKEYGKWREEMKKND